MLSEKHLRERLNRMREAQRILSEEMNALYVEVAEMLEKERGAR